MVKIHNVLSCYLEDLLKFGGNCHFIKKIAILYMIYMFKHLFIHMKHIYIYKLEFWGKYPLDLCIFMGLTDYKLALVLVMVWCHADDQS